MSDTKWKGAIGFAKVVSELLGRLVPVLAPVGIEHLPYDLVAEAADGFKKVQVKYREVNKRSRAVQVPRANSWSNSKGTHSRRYLATDFDILAVFVPELDRVLFMPYAMCGKSISVKPSITNDYYWYEDFLDFPPPLTTSKRRRTGARPSKPLKPPKLPKPVEARVARFKANWPNVSVLRCMLDAQPVSAIARDLGVSDNAVRKHCKALGLTFKPRGYWSSRR